MPNTRTLSIGTVGCNFKCPFCQNHETSQTSEIDKSIEITKEQIVALALKYECKSISYTYNEPTIFYPFAKDIGVFAKEYGLKNIFVSNGFQSKEIIEDMSSWVDAINVDLKSFNRDYYKKTLKGDLEYLKENLKLISKSDLWLEITTLIIDEINSSNRELKEIASFISKELSRDVPWHLSAFSPKYKMNKHKPTKLKSLTDGFNIAKDEGLNYVYIGNVPVPSETICPNCETTLLKRDSFELKSNILNINKCSKCQESIAGVWE